MTQEKLNRINELARAKKVRILTPDEAAEQAALRKEYLEEWRRSVIDTLEHTYIVDEQGNKRPLRPKDAPGPDARS